MHVKVSECCMLLYARQAYFCLFFQVFHREFFLSLLHVHIILFRLNRMTSMGQSSN